MKQTIFTLEDIKTFLLEQHFPEWTGHIYDFSRNINRKAIMADFDYSFRSTTQLQFYPIDLKDTDVLDSYSALGAKDVRITHFTFQTFEDESNIMGSGSSTYLDADYSRKWQEFLLAKYGKEYAQMLFDWSIKHISKIQRETDDKISKFATNEKDKASKQIEKYNDIAQQTMKYLSADEIDDYINKI